MPLSSGLGILGMPLFITSVSKTDSPCTDSEEEEYCGMVIKHFLLHCQMAWL